MLTASTTRCCIVASPGRPGAFAAGKRAQASQRKAVSTHATKLYTNPGSRGKIAEWYIAELSAPVELVQVNMQAKQHKSPEYLKLHPFGQVPVLDDDGFTVFESGAILLYLAAKYAKLDTAATGKAAQWTVFANSTLTDVFFGIEKNKRDSVMNALDGILAKQPYLEGDEFTLGDVAVGSYLLYLTVFFPDMFPIKQQNVWAYMQRLAAREACPATFKQSMAALVERIGGSSGGSGGLGGLFSKIVGGQ